jgi:hypothetical protein
MQEDLQRQGLQLTVTDGDRGHVEIALGGLRETAGDAVISAMITSDTRSARWARSASMSTSTIRPLEQQAIDDVDRMFATPIIDDASTLTELWRFHHDEVDARSIRRLAVAGGVERGPQTDQLLVAKFARDRSLVRVGVGDSCGRGYPDDSSASAAM